MCEKVHSSHIKEGIMVLSLVPAHNNKVLCYIVQYIFNVLFRSVEGEKITFVVTLGRRSFVFGNIIKVLDRKV